ncbi:MAG TPA: RNA polymerase sigma factor [Solirubrobacteraceae bacterium]|jgi:RNA polymerase sigma-70 factor (ECF subfamily)|nr:RNA polymerase sigma factor [Steroidobacteraceae bacterium]
MQPESTGELRGEDEASVVRRVAGGDRAAFTLLMRAHNRRLYRLARASLGDPTEAEDAVQDAYLNAYRSIGAFRGESALSTWLSRLVLNECLARQRRRLRRENVIPMVSFESTTENVSGIADEGADPPDKAAGRAQMRAILESKVGQLPETFRTVFVMRSVEELSVEETADVLGLTEETVRSRHFRARGLLRESLARDVDLAERDLFEFGGCHCDAIVARVLAKL